MSDEKPKCPECVGYQTGLYKSKLLQKAVQ